MTDVLTGAIEELGPDLRVLDCHGHLGPWENFPNPRPDAADIVRTMDLLGIETTFVSALTGMVDEEIGHAELTASTDAFPGRLEPVPIGNPTHGVHAVAYLERCRLDGRYRMLKVHPNIHETPILDAAYRPLIELATEAGWPVLSHTWAGDADCDPIHFHQLARAHSQATFILGHSGGSIDGIRSALDVARAHDNVYCDLTCSLVYDGVLEWMVRTIGDERIVFGSDCSFLDPRPQFGRVVMARVGVASKRRILGDNLRRLLGSP